MINNINKSSNIHRKYKKIIGTSVACLSMIATLTVGANKASANTDVLQPQLVQAIAYVPEQTETLADKVKTESIKYVGVPYVWGGTTPKGFDCSGFTQHVFKNIGVNLPRVASSQAAIDRSSSFDGKTITNKNDIQAGDLIFFSNTPGSVSHVGIALEDNKYIHASTSKRAITITDRSGSWYNSKFTKAIRVN